MTGARLASKLWLLWNIGGHPGEGRHWLERVVAAGDVIPPDLRAEVLFQAGQLAVSQGDAERAAPLLADALALARGSGVGWLQPMALRMQGMLAARQGEYGRAIPLLEEALRLFRESGDRPHVAHTLHHLGIVAYGQGDLSRARALCQEALDLAGTRHPLFTPWILNSLALIDSARGDQAGAAAALTDVFALEQDLHGAAYRLASAAVLAGERGWPDSVARLLGAAEAEALALGMPFSKPLRRSYERAKATARAALGEESFAAAWTAGQALTLEAAIAEARALLAAMKTAPTAATPAEPNVDHDLTPREIEVLRLVAEGLSNRAVAEALFIGRGTVHTHLASIYDKLGVGSRTAAIAASRRLGLL